MPLHAADELAVAIGGKADRPERDALVKFDVVADLTGFSDHDAGAVVNEEVFSDRGAG